MVVLNKGGVHGFVRATRLCRFSLQKCGLFYTYFKYNLHAWEYIYKRQKQRSMIKMLLHSQRCTHLTLDNGQRRNDDTRLV